MRITEGMLHDIALHDLNANMEAMARSQEQVSTTRRLNRPSDDPADVRAVINAQDTLSGIDQYLRNIDTAQRWTSAADTALGSATDDMQRVRELTVEAGNGTLSAADRASIAEEVEQLTGHLAQLASTQVGSAYIFSGLRSGTAPYAAPAAGTATVGAYQGDAGAVQARISPGTTVQTNLTADTVFGPAFAALQQLDADLRAGNAPSAATSSAIDAGLNAIVDGRTQIGARSNRLDATQESLKDAELSTKSLVSQLQDADMAQVISDFSQRQVVYQSSLTVSAKILQQSLLDVLR